MRKERTILFLGILIALFPYLGFPSLFRSISISILGLIVSFISYYLYLAAKQRSASSSNTQSFVDSNNLK